MSNDPLDDDTAGDIDTADISGVEQAIDGILNKVQGNLGFPYSTEATRPAPAVSLDYHFSAGIEVYLTTQWTLFEGFTLKNITLKAAIDKFKNSPGDLFVELSATALIGDYTFTVLGRIPRLSSDSDVSFVLVVQVQGSLNSVDPTDFVDSLTSSGYKFASVTDKLGPDLSSQLENENSGSSFATGAALVITKPTGGSTFLRQASFSFAGDIDWTLIPNHVQLNQVSLALFLDHPKASSPWTATLDLDAVASINNVMVEVEGQISLNETPSVSLAVGADPLSGTSPGDVFNVFIGPGTGATANSKLQLPPSAQLPPNGQDPFEADITIAKGDSGWYIEELNAKIFWHSQFWFPHEGLGVALQDLYFQYMAQRASPPEGKLPSEMPLDFSAAFGGSITLFDVPISAVVTYRSTDTTTTLTCLVDASADITLQQIAADPSLNIPSQDPRDINALTANANVPNSVPVDLTWCKESDCTTGVSCILIFTGSDLDRLQVSANYQLDWQVFSQLTVTAMGVYFDITNPVSSYKPSVVKGYAYGSVVIANEVNLFAFIAGVSQVNGNIDFLLGLTLTYDPTESLGITPQTVFSDAKFLGASPPTDLWYLPTSAPSDANVSDCITSINARLAVQIHQKSNNTTSLVAMQASVDVIGSWTIFDSIVLNQLSLNLVVKPDTQSGISYYAQLLGVVSDDQASVNGTKYIVTLAAAILHDAKEQNTTFTANITASYVGHPADEVEISNLLAMPLIGADPVVVQSDQSINALPSELSLSATTLLSKPVAQCSLLVQKDGNSWSLKELNASMTQTSNWDIIPGTLSITGSMLFLKIVDPRSPEKRKISFFATTTIKLGDTVYLGATISVVKGGDGTSDSITLTFSASNIQKVVNDLVHQDIPIPQDCPIISDVANYTATLSVVCKKDNKTNSYSIAAVSVEISAVNTSWTLGPLAVNRLALSAVFDLSKDPMEITLSFTGATTIASHPVDVLITLQKLDSVDTLILAITTPIEPTEAASLFITNGLDNSALQAPAVTSSSGLDGYKTLSSVSASITFLYGPTAWHADTLAVRVNSTKNDKWIIFGSVLWAQDLYALVALTHLSTTSQLQVQLGITFGFQAPTGFEGHPEVPCNLTATSNSLVGEVDTSACTLQSYLHVATGGFWDPPDILAIHLFKSLTMTMDWDAGTGKFVALCFDWTLPPPLTKLARMVKPRLEVELTKRGGGLDAKGQLAGTAYILEVPLELSYDLVDGPFRIYGLDVKEAYKMAQQLYKLLRNLEDVAKVCEEIALIMSELAEFTGIVDIAGDIFTALTALEVAKSIIGPILDQVFGDHGGGGGGRGSGNHDDPTNNGPSTGDKGPPPPKGQPSLVVGGSLLSPGPGQQQCTIVVYPKNKNGNYLEGFVNSGLWVVFSVNSTWQAVSVSWSSTLNGALGSLLRPDNTYPMKVVYSGVTPAIEFGFTNTVQDQPSVFSLAQSSIELPAQISCLDEGVVTLIPKDETGQPRLGPEAAPLLNVSFVNQESGPAPSFDVAKGFVVRNDCLLLPFSLLKAGVYTLNVTDPSDPANSQTRHITGVNSLSPSDSVAYGDGLSSGIAGTIAKINVAFKDQDGSSYIPTDNDKSGVLINMSVSGLTVPDVIIPFSIVRDLLTATYTRPTQGSYQITISVKSVLLGDGIYSLISTATTVSASVTKSNFTVWSNNQKNTSPKDLIAQLDQLEGLINTYDDQGKRWYQSLPNNDGYNVTWTSGFTPGSVKDNGDGTYSFNATAIQYVTHQGPVVTNPDGTMSTSASQSIALPDATAAVSVSSIKDPKQSCIGSPLSLKVVPYRQFAKIDAYGTGLEQGRNKTGFVQVRGYDQYGAPWQSSLNDNVKLQLVRDGASYPYTKSGISAFTYEMPADGSILVLLSPSRPDAVFKPQMYVVYFETSLPTDPSHCFVEWNTVVQNDISTATVYACNSNGRRRRQGGDLVQTQSEAGTPLIMTTDIADNLDGTYTVGVFLPDAAFKSSETAPQLQFFVNQVLIHTTQFISPLPPQELAITATTNSFSPPEPFVGKHATFNILIDDQAGHLTSAGYHGASAYLVQTGTDTPKYLECIVGANSDGIVPVTYNVPSNMGAGSYQVHVFVNSKEIESPTTTVSVRLRTMDDIDEACQITSWTLGLPKQSWDISGATDTWNIETADNSMTLKLVEGAPASANVPITWTLKLDTTDEWFQNGGFMFSFDVAIAQNCPIQIAPLSQPAQPISMNWSPGPTNTDGSVDNTQSIVQWKKGASAVTSTSEWVAIKPGNPATISFLYLLSNDRQQYFIYAFHAGQFIAQGSWAHDGNNVPKLGVSIARQAPTSGAPDITISSVKTIPTYFRTRPGADESASDIVWSEPWASKYVTIANQDGVLSNSGLVVHGDVRINSVSNPWIYQANPASAYNPTISVFSLITPQWYNFDPHKGPPAPTMIPAINFGVPYWDPQTSMWVNWNETVTNIANSNMMLSPTAPNTVMVISGKGCDTVFSDGAFQFTAARQSQGVWKAKLFSWWTDITWRFLRVTPSLNLATSPTASVTAAVETSEPGAPVVTTTASGGLVPPVAAPSAPVTIVAGQIQGGVVPLSGTQLSQTQQGLISQQGNIGKDKLQHD